MEPNVLIYIVGGAALIVGIIAGKLIFAKNTARQIEDGITPVPHGVLDVVAEDVEKHHVPPEVHPVPVHEHAGENRERLTRRIADDPRRNQPIAGHDRDVAEVLDQPKLDQPRNAVERDQKVIYHRRRPGGIGVADRDHRAGP